MKITKLDSRSFPQSFFINALAQVVADPNTESPSASSPISWSSAVQPELEQTCQNAFETFLRSEQQSWHVTLPNPQNRPATTLHFERLGDNSQAETCFRVTLSPIGPEHPSFKAEESYRQRYENLLQKTNLLMSCSQQVCWDWDLSKDTLDLAGPHGCMLGFQYSEIQSDSSFWINRIHPADSDETKQCLQETIDGKKNTWDSEYRCRTADNQYLWIKQFGVVTQRRRDGTAVHMEGTTQLIEERKRTENENLQLLERYRAIAESQGDAVVRVNVDLQITYYNSVFAMHFLHTDKLDLELTLEQAIEQYPNLADFSIATGTGAKEALQHSFLTHSLTHNGQDLRHLWQATSIGDLQNDAQEIQFSGRDVTALKCLEEALVNSNRENQAKDRFLAMISHDLKTPLNPILGFSEILMKRPGVDPKVSAIASSINSAGHQLHEHINSLLEISKMDPEIYDRESDSVTLNDLRSDFESTFSLKAEVKGISFLTSLSGPRDQSFALDKKLLRNVLNNLIDNAIKFTEQGKVLLMLKLKAADATNSSAKLIFNVIDDGPGIPPNSMRQIFEPFVRVDSSNSREKEGAGLGLSICRRALDILGGHIEPSRNIEHGMTFSGWIPVDSTHVSQSDLPEHSSDADFKPPPNTRTLIVDDIKSNREVLREVLSELELDSEACSDGATAIELISQNPYDIVFLDIHMPQMNGIETHNQLRSKGNGRPRPYFVAVTADSTPQTRQSCTESGIEDFITKPISRSKIKRVLGDFQKKKNRS
ncbi:response regulator [Pelagicoccus sp. SDUM812002]|uniref:PAS domain-containing hybrid sensor histidine kinase/response regulator n=1 Tax=Pelagicoccus sp. SDUM812002 TaxID=3041266 RepID=UPI00280D1860|nr:response regulator [Pelagicoccus sp. SDUM812002]MDQ8187114.1 response regulator [Pelagicoccus sp. SDUM812002]